MQGSFHAPQSTVAVPLTLVLVLSMKLPVCGTVMNQLHQAVYGAGILTVTVSHDLEMMLL